MEETGTAGIRAAAPEWTLAGDKMLLDILKNIHQSLMTKCEEVNQRLDEMVTALDDASVDLQNVNNKFMALSNTQFIESRVYDDDADVTTQEPAKEPSRPPETSSELDKLKDSLKILEDMHEVIQIIDSDTESDSEDDGVTRSVLKPKDLYCHRPLPHIIGSQAWRAKWHAGLLPEDSDSDSSIPKHDEDDEYSTSEPEEEPEDRDRLRVPDIQDSTTSSDITTDQDLTPSVAKQSPADVAAELARRLRGSSPKIPEPVPEHTPVKSTKVYRPEQPTTATIFSDEPPPLDSYQSEESEEDDDIFAELHKSKPFNTNHREHSRLADDLFSGLNESRTERDISDDFSKPPHVVNQKSTLFEDESEPEMFAAKPPTNEAVINSSDGAKKPVGGISLFGSSKSAESIGAAILKRNQRKSSSEEDIEEPPVEVKKETVRSKEKDIFDDLFAKSEKANKVASKKAADKKVAEATATKNNNNNKTEKKVDLFSDNLFDDIDNIFATNVVKVATTNNNKTSLFDDDDDDLFADIAINKAKPKVAEKKPDLFDDLFSEQKKPESTTKDVKSEVKSNVTNSDTTSNIKSSKSIFDDDSDTDIFSKMSDAKSNNNKNSEETIHVKRNSNVNNEAVPKNTINNEDKIAVNVSNVVSKDKPKQISVFDDDEIVNTDQQVNINERNNASKEVIKPKPIVKDKPPKLSIFDDEDDNNDIFSNLPTTSIGNKSPAGNENKVRKVEELPKLFHDTKKDICDNNSSDTFTNVEANDKTNFIQNNLNNNVPNEEKSANKETKSSLFDDSDDELFKKEVTSSVTRTNTTIENLPNNIANEEYVPATKSNNTFENDQRELFSDTKPTSEEVNQNLTANKTRHEIPEPDFIIHNADAKAEKTKDTLFSPPPDNICSDIMDEPPVFEKAKEPKKSKNINALFDDDSDDEALFFKKNDVILDDKPDFNVESTNDALFGIFNDEPPAVEVDFTQKNKENNVSFPNDMDDLFHAPTPNISNFKNDEEGISKIVSHNIKTTKINDILLSQDASEDFGNNDASKPENIVKDNSKTKTNVIIDSFLHSDSDNDLFKVTKPKVASKPQAETKSKSKSAQSTEPVKSKIPEIPKSEDSLDSPKKVGKLKSMNININVNTLLPGASPKKKPVEQIDGPALSTKSHEDLHSKEKVEPLMVKSVSFEGDAESQVLDNKISKERAKIQVKRRPSTRRARKEAVRKSAIDLGDDSTDNSSSFDDIPRSRVDKTDLNVEISKSDVKTDSNTDSGTNNFEPQYQDNNRVGKLEELGRNETGFKNKDVTSKVVYILNDEDIFNTTAKPIEQTKTPVNEENLFSNLPSASNKPISVGNVYKEESNSRNTENKVKKSIFDDLSDDENELFNTNKKITAKTKGILDSDSDEDLFSKKDKTETVIQKETKRKVEVKGSLFGDDEDEDDLFAVKTKVEPVSSTQVKPTREVVTKATEPVFDDPLSLLGAEED